METRSLRVLSWNLQGLPFHSRRALSRRYAGMVRRVVDHGPPDLLLLQEVFNPGAPDEIIERFADAGVAYEEIRCHGQTLKSGPYYVLYLLILPLLLALFWRIREGGLVALRRVDSSWRVSSARFEEFDVEGPWWALHEGDEHADKGFQQIELVAGHTSAVLFNTHLQAQYPRWESPERGNLYPEVRRAQLRQLTRVAASIPSDRAVVAVGDFNIRPLRADDGCDAQRLCTHSDDDRLYGELQNAWIDLTLPHRSALGCASLPGRARDPESAVAHSVCAGWTKPPIWLDYVLARPGPPRVTAAELALLQVDLPAIDPPEAHGPADAATPPATLEEATPGERLAISDHLGIVAHLRLAAPEPAMARALGGATGPALAAATIGLAAVTTKGERRITRRQWLGAMAAWLAGAG